MLKRNIPWTDNGDNMQGGIGRKQKKRRVASIEQQADDEGGFSHRVMRKFPALQTTPIAMALSTRTATKRTYQPKLW